MTMTIESSSAGFDVPADLRERRSLLRRFMDALMAGLRRKADREIATYLHRHQDPRDEFRIELERRFMGQ
jgi:hypothetical protein